MTLTTVNAVRGMVPVFRVASVARSVTWYRDVLGFSFDTFGSPTDPTFAQFCRDGVEFMLQKHDTPRREDRRGGWDAYVRVNDVHAFLERVRITVPDAGPITATEYGCQEFVVVDPDGHVIGIGECT
jgi:catechol 2,3-dioxygenase-like lactoylglutathione lyase family enzyme